MKKRCLIVFMTLLSVISEAQVKIYRKLPEFPRSKKFKVEIKQGSSGYQQIYTYGIPITERVLVTKVEHLCMLGFEPTSGPVDIKISSLNGQQLNENTIELVNKTIKKVSVSFNDDAMLIHLKQAKVQLFVRLKNDPGNPLNIFADPIQESPISPSAKVCRFKASDKPYVQNGQYDRFTIPNDVDVVYIEDGAMIKGTIYTAKDRIKPVKIMGHGVVLGNGGILHGGPNMKYNAVVLTKGVGNSIEGITVIKSRHFSMDIGKNGHIDNVKLLGYAYNNDGIVAGDHSIIENSFLKVNDDHIKLYHNDVIVRNCTFYAQTNGGIIQLAWNRIDPGDNCLVENCEVVASEYEHCGDPKTAKGGLARCFISLREAEEGGKVLKNDIVRNILIQGQLQRFIGINGYTFEGVTIDGLKLENVKVERVPLQKSWIYTKGANSIDIELNNVIFGNRPVQKDDFKTSGDVILKFDNQ